MLGRPRTTPIAAALAALTLAACGGEETVGSAEDVPAPTSSFGQDRDVGEQVVDEETGDQVVELGQWVEVTPQDEPAALFRIQELREDLDCSDGVAPENDRFVGLAIEVETNPDMERLGLDQLPMAAEDFQVRLTDGGVTGGLLGNGADCLPEDERLPDAVAPGENASGTVVLDVPEDVEAIVLDGERYQLSTGWVWPVR
jgi:hypothetical protein